MSSKPRSTTVGRRQFLAGAAGAAAVSATWGGHLSAAESETAELPVSELGRTPHTKFAVNVEMWWTKLPFDERLRQAAAFGYPAVEFWPWRNKNIEQIAELSEELGIEIAQFTAWGFHPGMNNPQNLDKFLQEVEASCQTAKKLKCRKMTVVGGDDQRGMTQAEMHAQIIEALKQAAPIAADHQVMLILEPMNIRVDHKGHSLYGSEDAVRICREVDSPWVKINWDLYHMQITEGDLCGRLKEGFVQVGYLQLADHPGRNEPGTGEVNYARVLRQAHELGYHDYVGLELRPKTDEETAARAVAAADVW